jgi:hypothetical protein
MDGWSGDCRRNFRFLYKALWERSPSRDARLLWQLQGRHPCGGGGFWPPLLSTLRRLPMQTIQENKQASFAPAAEPFRLGALLALLPPPPPAPRPGPVLGAPGELPLAGAATTYPGKGMAPYAPPAPSRSALVHPITLMTLSGEVGAAGLAPPGHVRSLWGPTWWPPAGRDARAICGRPQPPGRWVPLLTASRRTWTSTCSAGA